MFSHYLTFLILKHLLIFPCVYWNRIYICFCPSLFGVIPKYFATSHSEAEDRLYIIHELCLPWQVEMKTHYLFAEQVPPSLYLEYSKWYNYWRLLNAIWSPMGCAFNPLVLNIWAAKTSFHSGQLTPHGLSCEVFLGISGIAVLIVFPHL